MKSRMYGFGSNGSGQLGLAHRNDTCKPEPCKFRTFSPDNADTLEVHNDCEEIAGRIKKVLTGGNHTLVLMDDGRVWAAGDNRDSRCGFDYNIEQSSVFRLVDDMDSNQLLSNVTDIAATWTASFFIISFRKILVCGSGLKGELGLGPTVTTVWESMEPVTLDLIESQSLVKISASMGHVVVLTSDGQVYGWGACRKGQLGEGFIQRKVLWQPKRLTVKFSVVDVVTGRDFTLLIGHNGEHLLLGESKHIAGFDRVKINLLDPTLKIYASWSSLFLKADGRLTAFGRDDRGQTFVDGLPELESMAAGSEHCLAITYDHKIVAWGWGEHGNCGMPIDEHGDVKSRHNVIELNLAPPTAAYDVAAGCATSFVVVGSDS